MKQRTVLKMVLFSSLILVISAGQVLAQPQGRGRGLNGDYLIKSEFNGMTMESIVSFSRGEDGNPTGVWLGFMGMNELKDLTFADGKLSFTQVRQGRDGEVTSKFTGTLADGVLSGTMASDRGDREIKGTRMPRMPRAVGNWEMKYSMGDREMVSTLMIRADAEGNLTATWPSERVEHTITNLVVNRSDLSFKRTSKMGDREFVSDFTGTLQGNEITGTFKSDRGDMAVTGTRLGADVIGTWNLDVSSDFGESKNRLVVYPDMTARYGSTAIKAVALEGDKVTFKITFGFGERTFEMDFVGKIADSKLTGAINSERGSQTITGTKVARRARGQRGG